MGGGKSWLVPATLCNMMRVISSCSGPALQEFQLGMNALTKIIASIRYPESGFGKTLQRIVPILLLVFILILGFAAFAAYRIITPDRLEETIDPSSFLLRNYLTLSFTTRDNKLLEGWFIP